MSITVKIPTILRPLTGDQKSVQACGSTVAEVLAHLEARHPGVKARLVQGEKLMRFVNVYVNDHDIRFGQELNTPVQDGDVVTVLPAVAGG